jgi:UDP-N-acetylmuramoylalanine--D-glutamate ligase
LGGVTTLLNLSGKNITVCGILRSGINAALLASRAGANVTATDTKDAASITDEVKILKEAGVKCVTGSNPDSELLRKTDYMIISPGIPYNLPFISEALSKDIIVLPEIEFAAMFCEAPIAAVTGTNGKTTTTALLGEILKTVNPKSMALGNIGTAFSSYAPDIPPDAYAALEISSFQLEAVRNFKPKAAALLQITPDHLDRHKTMSNYVAIKAKIFENQSTDDYAILNYDDPSSRRIAGQIKSRIIFFSAKERLSNGIYINNDEIRTSIEGKSTSLININQIKIPGAHNIENPMAAAGLALAIGIPLNAIQKGVDNFLGVPHRIEYVGEFNGVRYYNDSKATNPGSAVKGLLAMDRPVVLIGGGYDKNAVFSEWVKIGRAHV